MIHTFFCSNDGLFLLIIQTTMNSNYTSSSSLVDQCSDHDIFIVDDVTDRIDPIEPIDEPSADRMQKAIDGLSIQLSRLEERLEAMNEMVKLLGTYTMRLNNQPLDVVDCSVFSTTCE